MIKIVYNHNHKNKYDNIFFSRSKGDLWEENENKVKSG